MLQVTANDALARTITIAATNAGVGGTALIDIDADDAITIDSAAAGLSLDGVATSNFTITANNALTQTLSISATNVAGGANIGVTAQNQLSLEGTAGSLICSGGAGVSIQSTGGAISIASDANNFGLNLGTGGARTVILGNVTGATSVTVNTGTGGFAVNTTGVGTIDINGTNAITIDAATGLSLDGVGASNLTATSGTLTLSTLVSGTLFVNSIGLLDIDAAANIDMDVTGTFDMLSTGTFSIDGTGASNVTATSGHLTLSTLTTGDVILSSIGYLVFKDAYYAASTYDTDLVLTDNSGEWDTFETNFGEVSLLNALNQAVTIGNASTVTVADTTSAACYVGLFEAATGNIAAKTDGGLL
jgi:hypothetical protein